MCAQSCLTVRDPLDCSPPGSSVHEILQARILEWVVISYFRGSSQHRDQTMSLMSPALAGGFFTNIKVIVGAKNENFNIKLGQLTKKICLKLKKEEDKEM